MKRSRILAKVMVVAMLAVETYQPASAATLLPPVITSPSTAYAEVGVPFHFQIVATNSPIAFAMNGISGSGLGLMLSAATGLWTGTPQVAGTLKMTVLATNSAGTGTAPLTIIITPKPQTLRIHAVNSTASRYVQVGLSGYCSAYNQCGDNLPWNNYYINSVPLAPYSRIDKTVSIDPDRLQWNGYMINSKLSYGNNCSKSFTTMPTDVTIIPSGTAGCVIF